jgi:hypothetical protein
MPSPAALMYVPLSSLFQLPSLSDLLLPFLIFWLAMEVAFYFLVTYLTRKLDKSKSNHKAA